jgi:hypothetical protein
MRPAKADRCDGGLALRIISIRKYDIDAEEHPELAADLAGPFRGVFALT